MQTPPNFLAEKKKLSGIGVVLNDPSSNSPADQPTFPTEMNLFDRLRYAWQETHLGKAVDLQYSLIQAAGLPSIAPRPNQMPRDLSTQAGYGVGS